MTNTEYLSILGSTISTPEQLYEFIDRDENIGKYFCSICNNFFHQSKSNVRNHVEAKHFPSIFEYKCDLCDATFSTHQSVLSHKSKKRCAFKNQ